MISIFVSAALMIGGISGEPQLTAPAQPEKISCLDGPVKHLFGGAPWLVFACSDERVMAVFSTPEGLGGSFYFIVKADGGTTSVMGEGTGSTRVTDAAHDELQKLPADAVRELIREAKAKGSQP
jgi:hypothetical protein